MRLLVRFTGEGRTVGEKPGKNYAPSRFAEETEAIRAKISKAALTAAMKRLFEANRIRVDTTNSYGHKTGYLVVA
jgi:hypothetical protein